MSGQIPSGNDLENLNVPAWMDLCAKVGACIRARYRVSGGYTGTARHVRIDAVRYSTLVIRSAHRGTRKSACYVEEGGVALE